MKQYSKKYSKIRSVASVFASIAAVASMGVSDLKAGDVIGDRDNVGQGHTLSGTWATISGGQTNSATATRSTVGGGLLNQALSDDSVICGGTKNTVKSGNTNSTIGGGFGNFIDNLMSSGTIGGGANNSMGQASPFGVIQSGSLICGGVGNTNRASVSTIVGGSFNTITGHVVGALIAGGTGHGIGGNVGSVAQTIGGGRDNSITVSGGTISGGLDNAVYGTLGTIPGGWHASATHYGQQAYASGFFAANGDAQTSLHVERTTTTGSSATELFLDNSSARMTIPSGSTWIYEIQVVARNVSASQSAGYTAKGVIDNFSGAVSFLANSVSVVGEDNAAWDLQVEADDTNDALVIKAVGAAATTIRWVATIRTTEVSQ